LVNLAVFIRGIRYPLAIIVSRTSRLSLVSHVYRRLLYLWHTLSVHPNGISCREDWENQYQNDKAVERQDCEDSSKARSACSWID